MVVHIYVDNVTAMVYINKRGGTKSARLNPVASKIVNFLEVRSLASTAYHIAGSENCGADAESRSKPDNGDWQLDRDQMASTKMACWDGSLRL